MTLFLVIIAGLMILDIRALRKQKSARYQYVLYGTLCLLGVGIWLVYEFTDFYLLAWIYDVLGLPV